METDVTHPCAGVLAPPPRESVRSRLWVEKPNLSDGLRREGSLLVLATLVIGLSFAINALNSRGFWVSIPCLFNKITKLPCLTCGLTRSFSLTAHGRFTAAFRMHPVSYTHLRAHETRHDPVCRLLREKKQSLRYLEACGWYSIVRNRSILKTK